MGFFVEYQKASLFYFFEISNVEIRNFPYLLLVCEIHTY